MGTIISNVQFYLDLSESREQAMLCGFSEVAVELTEEMGEVWKDMSREEQKEVELLLAVRS